MTLSSLEKFSTICSNISLNIPPEVSWGWDDRFHTALVAFERSEMELIFFPITQEFDRQWDISTVEQLSSPFDEYFENVFGIIPGQRVFTSDGGDGLILFAVWWPWGDGKRFSLRVGLFAPDESAINRKQIQAYLNQWLQI